MARFLLDELAFRELVESSAQVLGIDFLEFVAATRHLLEGDSQSARALFRRIVSRGDFENAIYHVARREIDRL